MLLALALHASTAHAGIPAGFGGTPGVINENTPHYDLEPLYHDGKAQRRTERALHGGVEVALRAQEVARREITAGSQVVDLQGALPLGDYRWGPAGCLQRAWIGAEHVHGLSGDPAGFE